MDFSQSIILSPIPEFSPHDIREETAVQVLEGRGVFPREYGNTTDISMLEHEPRPDLSIFMENTLMTPCLPRERGATSWLEFRFPHLETPMKVNGGVENSASKPGAEGEAGAKESDVVLGGSPCFNPQEGLVPCIMEKLQQFNSPGGVVGSTMSVLNGTHSFFPEISALALTAETEATGTQGADLKEALASSEILDQPTLTVTTDQRGDRTFLEDSTKSFRTRTFNVTQDLEPVAGPNLTVNVTTPNAAGPETGLMGNVTGEVMPDTLNVLPAGPNFTFNASKNLGADDDSVAVSEAVGEAVGQLGSSISFDLEDSRTTPLGTSTPLIVAKSFSFYMKRAPSDTCKMLPLLEQSGASSDAITVPVVHQKPPPAGAKPATRSLTRPSALPLRSDAKAQPSSRKSLACPSAISNPKFVRQLPRPAPSRLSLAPPPKTSGLQVPGASSASSTLANISRKTLRAVSTLAAFNSVQPRTSGMPPSKLQTRRQASGGRTLELKENMPSTSSLRQSRGSPLRLKGNKDSLMNATVSEPTGSSAGSPRGLKRPVSLFRGPQSKLPNLGGCRMSGVLPPKKSSCEDCAKLLSEIARLRADVAQCQEENDRLRADVAQCQEENDRLRAEHEHTTAKKSE